MRERGGGGEIDEKQDIMFCQILPLDDSSKFAEGKVQMMVNLRLELAVQPWH